MSAGKGDDIRPRQISDDEWEENYRRTFPKARKRGQAERDARRIGQAELFPERPSEKPKCRQCGSTEIHACLGPRNRQDRVFRASAK